jgi:hypothetical protein
MNSSKRTVTRLEQRINGQPSGPIVTLKPRVGGGSGFHQGSPQSLHNPRDSICWQVHPSLRPFDRTLGEILPAWTASSQSSTHLRRRRSAFSKQFRQARETDRHPTRFVHRQDACLAGNRGILPGIEPRQPLTVGIIDGIASAELNDGPRRSAMSPN